MEPLERLLAIAHHLNEADFDGAAEFVPENPGYWRPLRTASLGEFIRACALSAEVLDYKGRFPEAENFVAEARPDAQSCLIDTRSPDSRDLDFKWSIWLTLSEAHGRYRAEKYPAAQALLTECQRWVARASKTDTDFRMTRARIHYSLGQCFRQTGRNDEAAAEFERALCLSASGLVGAISGAPDRALVVWSMAKTMVFGLGWVYYVRGELTRATPLIDAGREMLSGTKDRVHHLYAGLLAAAVRRARGRENALEAIS